VIASDAALRSSVSVLRQLINQLLKVLVRRAP
jgi:hypothetical protein